VNDLLSVEEALDRILATIEGPVSTERVAVGDALGRVLAEPAISATALPPWDNSAMDGYAIRSADVAGAQETSPVVLAVVGEVRAGSAPDRVVGRGTAVRIATGAPLPEGADAVVPVEETTPVGADGGATGPRGRDATGPLPARVAVYRAVTVGGSIRQAGSDLAGGDRLLDPGMTLNPARISLLAGSAVDRVLVRRRPRVAVLATGDEIRAPGQPLGAAGIPDANGPGLRALVMTSGADAIDLGIAQDRLADVRDRLAQGVATADAIIVSGGVSVGPYDVVREAFGALGTVDLWRVAVQPGKPFAFGLAKRSNDPPVLLFGLPGNPVSTFVTFELFVRPAIRKLAGDCELGRQVDRAVLLGEAKKSPGRRAYLRVVAQRDQEGRIVRDERGRVPVRLAGGQGSHVISALAAAEALAIIPEDVDGVDAGTEVELWWLDR